jgi:hypothetical protein
MTKATRPLPFHGSTRGTALTLAAGLLILVGVVFQFGELGYAHTSVDNLWFIPVILRTIWRMSEICLRSCDLQDVLRFWPLALVTAGVAMLWSVKRAASSGAPSGENNA